jgi:hypothetical protein
MAKVKVATVVADALGAVLFGCSAIVGKALIDLGTSMWDILAEHSDIYALITVGLLDRVFHGALLALLVASAAYAIARFSRRRLIAAIPLMLNVVVLLLVWFYPFTSVWIHNRFDRYSSQYETAVSLVEHGALAPAQDTDTVPLPAELAYLSTGGEIRVNVSGGVTRVFFYTFSGLLDNYSGFMYRSDNSSPLSDNFAGDWDEVHELIPAWFFCASH